jgi:hypothetical protein
MRLVGKFCRKTSFEGGEIMELSLNIDWNDLA